VNLPADLLPHWLLYLGLVLYLAGTLAALVLAPWRALSRPTILNLSLAASAALIVLWRLEAGLLPGLSFHFLAVTAATLLLGWSLAVLATLVAELTLTLIGGGSFVAFGINGLLSGLLPASLTYLLYRLYRRQFPQHLFVYIFAVAFLGGAIVAVVNACIRFSILASNGAYTVDRLTSEYLPLLPLYAFPEAVLNGMLVTIFAVFRPDWVKTLHRDTRF